MGRVLRRVAGGVVRRGDAMAAAAEADAEGSPLRGSNALVLAQLREQPLTSMLDVARAYGRLMREVDAQWTAAQRAEGGGPEQLDDPNAEAVRRVILGEGSITDIAAGTEDRLYERDQRDELRKRERKVEEWHVESSDAPPRAMVLVDKDSPVEPVIFERGNIGRRGPRVPRQPPRILSAGESRPFTSGSGRLELAQTIVDPANPLTARVIVNRVWNWHMGKGLVDTLSDFGTRGSPPTHPELLDWLAWQFVHTDGWSLKALHRRIVLSQAYQQSSNDRPEARAIDSENQLYWRMNRQRLDFEAMRDSMLAAAGRLDPAVGGRPVNIEQPPFNGRRSIYAKIDRNNFSPLLRTFDFASPDATSPGRPVTTVPQQALYVMNSPFVQEMAKSVAERARNQPEATEPAAQVTAVYRAVLSRDPAAEEASLAVNFVTTHEQGLQLLAQTLLVSNEFFFAD
ncbi:MAG: DUF1553 domain-containing protein [Planctomycetaceae bacterium]